MSTLRLQVSEGLTLIDPAGRSHVGGKPFEAPRTQFWLRRIADGSVREVEATPAKAAKPSAKK